MIVHVASFSKLILELLVISMLTQFYHFRFHQISWEAPLLSWVRFSLSWCWDINMIKAILALWKFRLSMFHISTKQHLIFFRSQFSPYWTQTTESRFLPFLKLFSTRMIQNRAACPSKGKLLIHCGQSSFMIYGAINCDIQEALQHFCQGHFGCRDTRQFFLDCSIRVF